jgi:signal transduction histidine kinase
MGKKIFAVWICLGLAITIAVYLFTYQEKLRLDLDRTSRAQETLSLVNDLESNLAEAAAAARGFVIAGGEGQLEKYPEALAGIDRIFASLLKMTATDPKQQNLLSSLKPLIDRMIALLEQTIEVRRHRGLDDPELAALAQASTLVHNKIMKIFSDLENIEKRRLDPERAKEEKKARIWLWGLTMGAYLSLGLLLLFLYLLNKEVAERRKVEEKLLAYQADLRSLASQVTLAEEHERRRIAGYLHDRIGNTLALVNIKLGELQKVAVSSEAAALEVEVEPIGRLLKQAIQDTQSLTFQISSPILYELGFEAAVEWLTEQFANQHGISTYFEADAQPKPLDDDVRTLLYQAVNELMVNAVKHAQARNLKVAVWREADELRVEVDDDGVGFKHGEVSSRWNKASGFGLFSIRERLKPFGGRMEVESAPGAGAQVTLAVPLKTMPQPNQE